MNRPRQLKSINYGGFLSDNLVGVARKTNQLPRVGANAGRVEVTTALWVWKPDSEL